MSQRAFHHGFRRRRTVFLQQIFFQRSAVDANTNGYIPRSRCIHQGLHPVFSTDIAGIKADGVYALPNGFQGQPIVEMNIRYQWNINALFNCAKTFGSSHIGHCRADDFTPHALQFYNLRNRGRDITILDVRELKNLIRR